MESPTGTGKTLCLFAPVAAWVRKRKDDDKSQNQHLPTAKQSPEDLDELFNLQVPNSWGFKKRARVFYTARTHSQLAQTVSEVRKCNITGLNITVMGARDQLCINPQVLEEKDSYVKVHQDLLNNL